MRTRKTKRPQIQLENRPRRAGAKMQTTLRLPRKLYDRIKSLVQREQAGSVNDFIIAALLAHIRAMERKSIDEAFRGMASDKRYLRETRSIMAEFAASDSETIALADRYLAGG